MRLMKAALYDGKRMWINEIPRPTVAPDSVVIQVRASGICGSDLNFLPTFDEPQQLPSGHEVAGEIVELGPGTEGWSIGDRVALDTICQGKGCGECVYCVAGQHFHCINRGSDWIGGGFAEYIHRKAVGCHRLPDRLSWSEGALVEPLAVAVHAYRRAELSGEESVVVLGSGTIGLNAVAAARAMGASRVFATARHKHQADMALALGADRVFDPDDEGLCEAVVDATQGLGADLVVEAVGSNTGETIKQAIKVCRPLGKVVVLGVFHDDVKVGLLTALLGEKDMIFPNCYGIVDGRHDFDVAIGILATGGLPLEDLVTHTYALDQAQEALEAAYDKSTGSIKVQLVL